VKAAAISLVAGFVTWRLTEWLGTRIGWSTARGAIEVLVIASTVGLALSAALIWIVRIGNLRSLLGRTKPAPAAL
jgi:hypothetical protein